MTFPLLPVKQSLGVIFDICPLILTFGLWWHLFVDYYFQQDRLMYNIATHNLPLLTITPQFIYFQICHKLFILINVVNTLILLMFSVTRGIYPTSVRPGRKIPHLLPSLRFLSSFPPVNRVFWGSFSLLLLGVKGRGCHTLLSPMRQFLIWEYGLYMTCRRVQEAKRQ